MQELLPHHHPPRLAEDRTTLEALGPRVFAGALGLGVLGLGLALVFGLQAQDGLRHFSFSYLVSFAFWLSISLGALCFVAIQHLTRASWSVVVRRLAELLAANLPLLGLLSLPVFLNLARVYAWAGPEAAADSQLAFKLAYLNPTFFGLRWLAYFVIWSGLALWFWRRSLGQDSSRDPQVTIRMENLSGPTLVVFAITVTLASFDLLMSLDPAWYSTIFGVYFFAGGFVGFFALMTILTLALQRGGRLARVVTIEHYHDYGKLMFAFVFFWAYIAFSQYLLIWYSNIPEETVWFLQRQEHGWADVALVLLFGHFLLPFLGLISRYAKRHRALLGLWAVWIFAMHWCDLYWVVMPEFSPGGLPLAWLDLCCFLGIGGIYLAGLVRLAGSRSLVPSGDPRLEDALRFENA
jgi:hypothetical protein